MVFITTVMEHNEAQVINNTIDLAKLSCDQMHKTQSLLDPPTALLLTAL